MGITLKEFSVYTTNSDWKKEFFDRTTEANRDKPAYKMLKIINFGVYWVTNEERFLSHDL